MQKQLTQGRPFTTLLRFTLPVVGGNLFQLFYTLADTVIVGRTLGANALAAVGATSIVSYFLLCFIQGLTGGFGICLGQACGANDQRGMRQSGAVSWLLSLLFSLALTPAACALTRPLLTLMKTPAEIAADAYDYLFVILLGTGATIFYNAVSYMLRALGDSRTPLFFLIFSSLLNIALDLLFIVPCGMGVAGAAWATILSQLLSAVLCAVVALRRFPALRSRPGDFAACGGAMLRHLRVGFLMGFQMSVMCIGQIAMQAAVNALGTAAIAGYTAASKVDQLSVLINNAFGIALSSYVAQNNGAREWGRIRQGVRACLIQALLANLLMAAALLLGREAVVLLFIDAPTTEIVRYASGYLLAIAPFYPLLGMLLVFRSSVQSMENAAAPFAACIVELILRIASTQGLATVWGYTSICLASPLAWLGATALLIPVYRHEIRKRLYPQAEI